MAVTIVKKKQVGTALVQKKSANGSTEEHSEQVATGKDLQSSALATVQVELGNTVNMGNYESAKFAVTLSMPSEITKIDETYAVVFAWVDERLAELNSDVEDAKA